MEKKMVYSNLLALLSTEEDVASFVASLEALRTNLYKKDAVFDALLSSSVPSRFFYALQDVFRDATGNTTDVTQIQTTMDAILADVHSLQVVHMTLAFDPTLVFLQEIVSWLREQISDSVVLAVTVDTRIVGGFLMDYAGHYWDFSIRASFEKLFSGNNLLYLVNRAVGQ